MSDVATGPAVEQPQVEAEAPALSITEHAKLHGPTAEQTPAETKTVLEEKAAHHSEQQRREKDGKWQDGKVRHRAESQKARPEDVPRIAALTARAKGAEERLNAAEAELTRLRAGHAPAAQIARAEQRVEREEVKIAPIVDASDPEPTEDNPKYGGDYGKYLIDQARWAARDERRQELAREQQAGATRRQQESEQQTIKGFGERVTAAKERYGADFDAALQWDAPWLQPDGKPYANGVEINNWVMKHKTGTDVLLFLHQHPDEVQALAVLEPFEQVERLTLLSQRFTPAPATAGSTGAATRTAPVKLPPRPPTPVRTEAQSAGRTPPPTDGTLSIADHKKAFGRKQA